MSLLMSTASVLVFEVRLNALSGILDKAEAFARTKKVDDAVLMALRLAPDMFPLSRQVQIAADQAKNASARLAGVNPPGFDDNETTIEELRRRVQKTVGFIQSLDRAEIDASSERQITFPLGATNKGQMSGADYLNHFALPNFYFHLTTAYAILRHCGVDLGKFDFLGTIPLKKI